jgi:transcription antitermination factor NusB
MTSNPSLQKKTAARTATVQCLYTLAVGGDKRTPQELVAALKKRLENNRDEQKLVVGMSLEPNYKMVETLLAGVRERKTDIDARIDGTLSTGWKRERMSPILVSILECGIFEMLFSKEISHKIVIDEYTKLARSFFGEDEVGFVHGALSQVSKSTNG